MAIGMLVSEKDQLGAILKCYEDRAVRIKKFEAQEMREAEPSRMMIGAASIDVN